jgi:hypothetical protein
MVPLGWHCPPKPTRLHRSPAAQSASLPHEVPASPPPAGAQVRPPLQKSPAAHSAPITQAEPVGVVAPGTQAPASSQVSPERQV